MNCFNFLDKLNIKKLDFILSFLNRDSVFSIVYSIFFGISVGLNIYQYVLIKKIFDLVQ
jgi:hypothetical protein